MAPTPQCLKRENNWNYRWNAIMMTHYELSNVEPKDNAWFKWWNDQKKHKSAPDARARISMSARTYLPRIGPEQDAARILGLLLGRTLDLLGAWLWLHAIFVGHCTSSAWWWWRNADCSIRTSTLQSKMLSCVRNYEDVAYFKCGGCRTVGVTNNG